MSSTNVHSEKQSNKYCAAAQIIPTTPEKGLDIPPKNAKPGPSRMDIMNDDLVLNISAVGEYEIKKDGTVVDLSSKGKIGKISLEICEKNEKSRVKVAPSKYKRKDNKEIEH